MANFASLAGGSSSVLYEIDMNVLRKTVYATDSPFWMACEYALCSKRIHVPFSERAFGHDGAHSRDNRHWNMSNKHRPRPCRPCPLIRHIAMSNFEWRTWLSKHCVHSSRCTDCDSFGVVRDAICGRWGHRLSMVTCVMVAVHLEVRHAFLPAKRDLVGLHVTNSESFCRHRSLAPKYAQWSWKMPKNSSEFVDHAEGTSSVLFLSSRFKLRGETSLQSQWWNNHPFSVSAHSTGIYVHSSPYWCQELEVVGTYDMRSKVNPRTWITASVNPPHSPGSLRSDAFTLGCGAVTVSHKYLFSGNCSPTINTTSSSLISQQRATRSYTFQSRQ